MKKENSKNKMAQMPVGRLMINMGIPMILSMMLQAVYNIVDSAFVSNMESNGEAALNALTLAFPVQMLMVAVGIGTGVGTNALLSKCMGQGNREKASRVTGTAFFLTAYGLYYKIQQFVLFAAFGMRDAITPIVSFNHGMKSKKRMTDGIKYGIIYTLIIMLAGTLLIEALANPFAAVFGLSGETQSLCIGAIRIVSLSFVFAGLNIALQGVFRALNGGMESLVISVLRQFLFVIPVAWGIARLIIQADAYTWLEWAVFPVAELLTLLVAAAFTVRLYKKKIAFLEG